MRKKRMTRETYALRLAIHFCYLMPFGRASRFIEKRFGNFYRSRYVREFIPIRAPIEFYVPEGESNQV